MFDPNTKQTVPKIPERAQRAAPPTRHESRQTTLKAVEIVFDVLLNLEHAKRNKPMGGNLIPINGPQTPTTPAQTLDEWNAQIKSLTDLLWSSIRVMDPIDQRAGHLHPFVSLLSINKGKRAIPRVLRLVDEEKCLTIITMIIAHASSLDVIKNGSHLSVYTGGSGPTTISSSVNEDIEVFSSTILQPMLAYIEEKPMRIVIGLFGILNRSQ